MAYFFVVDSDVVVVDEVVEDAVSEGAGVVTVVDDVDGVVVVVVSAGAIVVVVVLDDGVAGVEDVVVSFVTVVLLACWSLLQPVTVKPAAIARVAAARAARFWVKFIWQSPSLVEIR
jgi:hypothetical protein